MQNIVNKSFKISLSNKSLEKTQLAKPTKNHFINRDDKILRTIMIFAVTNSFFILYVLSPTLTRGASSQ